MMITMQDARESRLGCAWGMRRVARRYGLDVQKFLREGIAAEELLATGDAQLRAIVEYVKARDAGQVS